MIIVSQKLTFLYTPFYLALTNEPSIQIQEFVPNEYCSICWGVQCDVEKANDYENYHYNSDQEHRLDHCGTLTNQWVIDDNGDGTVDRMIETGTEGLGNLNCIRYIDGNYWATTNFSNVKIGSYIYWTTSSGDRTWHHQGKVVGTDSSHPNRS